MKAFLSVFTTTAVLMTGIVHPLICVGQIPLFPDATISVSTALSNVAVVQTFTVTCRLTSYTRTNELDGFAFVINYNPAGLSVVPGSFNLGTNSGFDQQYLSRGGQDSMTNGFALTNLCDATRPGLAYITVADIGIGAPPRRGSAASSGFLVSFQMTALAPGAWQLTPTPYIDNSVLYDTFQRPVGTVQFSTPIVVVQSPTTVMVQAVDASASEPGTDTGMFLFTRNGSTNSDLVVRYSISGSATSGEDYEIVPWWLVIPAGASNTSLVITPVDDTEIEGDETVTLTLQSTSDYVISGAGTATIIIHDDENPPPVVAITGPANGTIFPQPTNIVLTATASDSNGSVTNVEFYRDGTVKLGQDSTSPYSFTWTNAPPGTYVLTARATDNLGATADSVPISVTVRGPPSVTVTCPTNFFALTVVSASATRPDGTITFIEIYRDGVIWAATNAASFFRIWSNAVPGIYTLTARASDDRGLLTTSAPVVVTVTSLGMSDMFGSRSFINGFTNYTTANSTSWTWESGEPLHAGGLGSRSGWIAWTAPASGSVTIDTFGSSFDTVLAVYTNSPPSANAVSNLAVVASNNDAGGSTQSQVGFTAVAGQSYSIAVDGHLFGQSGTIYLHIYESNAAPLITASPQSQVATVGDNVSFAVTASGGSLSYQWRWKGTNLSGATASSLTLTNVALTSVGLYDVIVSNSGGTVTSGAAVLVVRAPADFTAVPSTQVVDVGDTATFTASGTGSNPLNYQWTFKGVLLPGEVTNSYTRYNVQYADGGTYQVTVANAAGSATAGAELIVRPLFTSLIPTNGTLLLNWYGTTGKVYFVEGTTNLDLPNTNWTTLGSVTNTALQAQFQVSLTNPPARVLRLRVGP